MSETLNEAGTGNLPPRRGPGLPPSTITASGTGQDPAPEKIEWVTREESEHLETLIGKNFVRKVERETGESKKYFYTVVSACPYNPSGVLSQKNQSLVNFNLQKFHRNKFSTRKRIGSEVDEKFNEAAQWVEIDKKTGDSEVIDADANFFLDSREFEKQFKRDNE